MDEVLTRKIEVRNTMFRVLNFNCRVRNSNRRIQSSNFRVENLNHRVPSLKRDLPKSSGRALPKVKRMKKLILQEFISIDGFAADREKTTAFFDGTDYSIGKDVDKHQGEFCKSVDLILLGTNTYKMFAEYWVTATSEDSAAAEPMNSIPKIVFSKSLKEVQWGEWGNISLVSEDAVSYIKNLKDAGGKNMVMWGSISLAQSLLKANLFDEIQLFTAPVVIGKGYDLFSEEFKLLPFKLTDTKNFSEGATLRVYEPQKPLR